MFYTLFKWVEACPVSWNRPNAPMEATASPCARNHNTTTAKWLTLRLLIWVQLYMWGRTSGIYKCWQDMKLKNHSLGHCVTNMSGWSNLNSFAFFNFGLAVHPLWSSSIVRRLSRLWRQQVCSSDVPLPAHILQLFLGEVRMFPGQMGYTVKPFQCILGLALWSSPSWTCLVYLPFPGGILIRCPIHLSW